jgi:hypothetical protein
MATWDPSALAVMSKNDGDILFAANLKEVVNSLKAEINGNLGNVNISSSSGEKIAYSKLNLAGAIQDADIVSISVSKFSSLKVSAQGSPNNTVLVAAGTFIKSTGKGAFSYAGGNSSTFPNPSVGLSRIDVLVIDDAGTLSRVVGTESGSPVTPDYPTNKVPLAEIFVRYNAGGVVIRNTDNGTDSYIKLDARPFFRTTDIPDGSITGVKIADLTIPSRKLLWRIPEDGTLSQLTGVAFDPHAFRAKAITNIDANPVGNGAVRNGKVYFSCIGRDYVTEWDHVADTMNVVTLVSGDHPGGLVKVGDNLYVICNDAYVIKKIDANNVVTTAVDLVNTGAAKAAWTLVNSLIVDDDPASPTFFTLAKITGTNVSQILRVRIDGTGVTHAANTVAGDYLAAPAFFRAADGTEYVVVFYDDNPFTGNISLRRYLAADLSGLASFSLATSPSASLTPLGGDGQYYYIWDGSLGTPAIRVVDVTASTMLEIARFTLGAIVPAGSPNEISTAHRYFRQASGNGNQYAFFNGRGFLIPMDNTSGSRPIVTQFMIPNWSSQWQMKFRDNGASSSVFGFATDGQYNFAAVSNDTPTAGAELIRWLA